MLPPATERVWRWLAGRRELGGFVLIGGTALTLRIGHRMSEDLDFAWLEPKLPLVSLQVLQKAARAEGIRLVANDSPRAVEEFLFSGMELTDYQQDYVVEDEVNVSFFALDPPWLRVLAVGEDAGPRVATLGELFATKALVAARRSKSRDSLDLYLLMTRHGFSISDFHAVFVKAHDLVGCDMALSRLCAGHLPLDDEGFASLLPDPPSLAEMTGFFRAQREVLEIDLARRAAARDPL